MDHFSGDIWTIFRRHMDHFSGDIWTIFPETYNMPGDKAKQGNYNKWRKKQARAPAQKQCKFMHSLKMAMVKKVNLTEDGKPAKSMAK